MPKNRVRLEICGVHCSLLSDESEEYMLSLAKETEDMMNRILKAPGATVEIAAVTAALSFLDESKKSGKPAVSPQDPELIKKLREAADSYNNIKEKLAGAENRIKELEEKEKELKTALNSAEKQKAKANEENEKLGKEILSLRSAGKAEDKPQKHNKPTGKLRNPMRPMEDYEQQGMVSFFEKK